jgi:hypothetical protein
MLTPGFGVQPDPGRSMCNNPDCLPPEVNRRRTYNLVNLELKRFSQKSGMNGIFRGRITEDGRQGCGSTNPAFNCSRLSLTAVAPPLKLSKEGQLSAPAVVSHSVRTMLIRSSILRMMERRLELRLCSILSPVKKVRTKSARESASIFGCSTSIFLAMSCFSLFLLRLMISTASGGNIGNSRMELMAKHPLWPSRLHPGHGSALACSH